MTGPAEDLLHEPTGPEALLRGRPSIPMMPDGRSSRYVVARFGYLVREEHMNIAVLSWEHNAGDQTPVLQQIILDWEPIARAFPGAGADGWVREEVITRLEAIKTFGDYRKVLDKMGPYTPFEFSDERPSAAFPEDTLRSTVQHFLAPYGKTRPVPGG